MLKLIGRLVVVLAFAGWIGKAAAGPILSLDGSLLSGLDVGGTLYDIKFGDGREEELYSNINFDAARYAEANAVSAALVLALNLQVPIPDTGKINGCDQYYTSCYLINPDHREDGFHDIDGWYVDDEPVVLLPTSASWLISQGGIIQVTPLFNSANFPGRTFVTYARSDISVPAPASILLLGAGLTALGYSRRKREQKT